MAWNAIRPRTPKLQTETPWKLLIPAVDHGGWLIIRFYWCIALCQDATVDHATWYQQTSDQATGRCHLIPRDGLTIIVTCQSANDAEKLHDKFALKYSQCCESQNGAAALGKSECWVWWVCVFAFGESRLCPCWKYRDSCWLLVILIDKHLLTSFVSWSFMWIHVSPNECFFPTLLPKRPCESLW